MKKKERGSALEGTGAAIVRRGRDEKCFGFLPSLRTNAPFFSIDRFVYRNLGCAAENDVASRY